jgi:hypothetical protein
MPANSFVQALPNAYISCLIAFALRRLLLLTLLTFTLTGQAQSILESPVTSLPAGNKLTDYLQKIKISKSIQVYYLSEWLQGIELKPEDEGQLLRDVLYNRLLGTRLSVIELNEKTLVFVMDPEQELLRNAMLSQASREQKKIDKVVMGNRTANPSARRIILTGSVIDSKSRQVLPGASIQSSDGATQAITDDQGKFELSLITGKQGIRVNYINYEEKVIDLEMYENGSLVFSLEETPKMLEEIFVQDYLTRELVTSEIGLTQLNMTELRRAPSLLGVVDIIKQIQLLPGVTSVGEAASGFNVRGGSVDQNLILYDGLPVFNSAHLFGFFSAFNAEAVRDASFYNGGIPAEYGGRVSSVLDIRAKEGSMEKWNYQAGIGTVSANLFAGGPIVKNKNSLAVSLRTTYSDWILRTVPADYLDLRNSSASFYDGTIKYAHQFSPKTKLLFSFYKSHDQFRIQGDSTFRWDTNIGSIRLDHNFSQHLSGALTIGYGTYAYQLDEPDRETGFTLNYAVQYPTLKLDFLFEKNRHKVSFGAQSMWYAFNPGTLKPGSPTSNRPFIQMENQQSLETGLYLADQFRLSQKLTLDAGLRLSNFIAFGPATVYLYQPGVTRDPAVITDTLNFSSGEKIKTFTNLEPRIGLRYEVTPHSSIKASYNRMFQYLQLVTNATAITPVDIWQPSGYYFKPQQADQFSLGYFMNFKEKAYEAFVEVYYKTIKNVLDFKDGAQLILNEHIETDLLQGSGEAYGVETQLTKKSGRLNGSISYTYSRSFLTLNGDYPEEVINNGNPFPANFDQPHVVNINWRYTLSKRIFFTGGFTYHTGRPISLPLTAFYVGNNTVSAFSERNQYRIPDYHRLDLGLVVEGSHKRKKLFDGTWTFSVYNVYARKNPYTIFFKEVRPGILRPYQLSIIGTVLPSITYSLSF